MRPSGSTGPGWRAWGIWRIRGPDSFQSGVGVISGWVCAAALVEVAIETESGTVQRHVAAYGTERLDTQAVCGDVDNGFGLLVNWNRLGEGEHTVVAYVDEVELGRATVRVTTVGAGAEEEFLRGGRGRMCGGGLSGTWGRACCWSGSRTVRILSLRMWSKRGTPSLFWPALLHNRSARFSLSHSPSASFKSIASRAAENW